MNASKMVLDIIIFLIIIQISSIAGYILLASNLFTRFKMSTGNKSADDFIKVPNYYFEKLIDFVYNKFSK